jgi:hypothetical protein
MEAGQYQSLPLLELVAVKGGRSSRFDAPVVQTGRTKRNFDEAF